ncbi:MAG TPA: hypothetical protein VEP30_11120, partial [Chthoniobacterales bacterium]|nr:hypothetical protein [Chthoniobacterales bacterium]
MRFSTFKTYGSEPKLAAIASIALTIIGLLCLLATFAKTDNISSRHFLLPRPAGEQSIAPNSELTVAPAAATPSPNWKINHHGTCCEGNLATQGSSVYVLLPVLVTGNKIFRSDDHGQTWTRKYPPADASVPYGIEGDLQAWGNDIDFFGTLVAQGVSAHSSDRG